MVWKLSTLIKSGMQGCFRTCSRSMTQILVIACHGGSWEAVSEMHNEVDLTRLAQSDLEVLLLMTAIGGQTKNHCRILQFLVKVLGANINTSSEFEGKTAFSVAASLHHFALMTYMVKELGVNVDYPFADGRSCLHMAISEKDFSLVRKLVELGADVNFIARGGRTPLWAAARAMEPTTARFLLRHGADPQAETETEGTPAWIAKNVYGEEGTLLTAYLRAKEHCSNPGCSGAGLKKCQGCKQARYCGNLSEAGHTACQLAHWEAHKSECKVTRRWNTIFKAIQEGRRD
jgi:hypothetical protein